MEIDSTETAANALAWDDLDTLDRLLEDPRIRAELNQGWFGLSHPPLVAAKSTEAIQLLIGHGADLSGVSEWWGPGFGLRGVDPTTGAALVEQGATLSPHAAAALGLEEHLAGMIGKDPDVVHLKGGDGGRPLHFARNLSIASLLIARGAEIDALDDDHQSTPCQWLIGEAPEVVEGLISAGANLDIFVAAAMGSVDGVARVVHRDPSSTAYRIGYNLGPFPGIGFEGRGGTILQWTLGFNASPHEIALSRGHREVFDFLMSHTERRPKLLVACMVGDEQTARAIVDEDPNVLSTFSEDDHQLLAKACWETNRNIEAVRIMLALGVGVDVPELNHLYSPLHNAAFDGNASLVELLLNYGHPVDVVAPKYHSTPLGACLWAATEGRVADRDYAGVVDRLLCAGATISPDAYPTGDARIDAVIDSHL